MTGEAARRVAIDALVRIDRDDAYANLALGPMLDRSRLDKRDRALVTELVYGTIRRRRACDFLVDRFLSSDPPATARASLRVGAYQLRFTDIPDHAAVAATVEATANRFRGLVNAVLRKVASAPVEWPDEATRLSYPDWIVDRLTADLGAEDAIAALEAMNTAPHVSVRDDGYTQDVASQWVADAIEACPGVTIADLCAAPGGKATALAASGARVIAVDIRPSRVGLIARNIGLLGLEARVLPVVGDGLDPPLRPGSFDSVLVDAPCSGLGVLHRRPDARWRITADDVDHLAQLQRGLIESATTLVRPGGTLIYSVCTLTHAESVAQGDWVAGHLPALEPVKPMESPWTACGGGSMLLPQDAATDGMCLFRWRVTSRK